MEPASNTRLGPAIRHSVRKLDQISAKTKLIILLSDGEPYDTARGEENYQGFMAEEDTRIAIQEGRGKNINFFCITVDTEPGEYLDNIFSDVGYTIIDDAQMLPEMLPLLYKRITT
jgi:nitric oxide reductase activation protein